MVSAEPRGYNGGLGAEPPAGLPPAGSRGRAPIQGVRAFSWMYVPRFRQISPFLMFVVKRRKMIFKHRQTTNIRAVILSLALRGPWSLVVKHKSNT